MKLSLVCPRPISLLALVLLLPAVDANSDIVPITTPTLPTSPGGDSMQPIVSSDGRFVLFASSAPDLAVAGSTNNPRTFLNVFLRDRASQETTLVSVSATGDSGGNGNSFPVALSTNGLLALFESTASNLVAGDTNDSTDVFLRDLVKGTNLLISVNPGGKSSRGNSWQSSMSADARFVVFSSTALDLVANDTNVLSDIFVRDLQAKTTALVSTGAVRVVGTTSGSDSPAITPDGRFVVFVSSATNLVPSVTTPNEIYVRDLVNETTTCASAGAHAYFPGAIMSYNHAISEDGQYVAFESSADASSTSFGSVFRFHLSSAHLDVVATDAFAASYSFLGFRHFRTLSLSADGESVAFVGKTNAASHIYVWNAQANTTTVVTRDLSDALSSSAVSDFPQFDDTGRFVAFLTTATNLTTNVVSEGLHLYVRDLQSGVIRLIDGNPAGAGLSKDFVNAPQMARGAAFVAFDCSDSDLVPGDNNGAYDIFLHDLATGTNELISSRNAQLPSQTPAGIGLGTVFGTSADGSFVTFSGRAASMLHDSTNLYRSIFARDLAYGTNILVSADTNGLAGANGMSTDPAISGDGRWVAFVSSADNLVANDSNKFADVFLRAWKTGSNTLVSISTNGVSPGNGASGSPQISSDGRKVLFRTRASNLGLPLINAGDRLILRDIDSGISRVIAPSNVGCEAMTPDGRFVAFGGVSGNMYLWDSQLASRVLTNNTLAISNVAVSTDGNRLAGQRGSQVYVVDRAAGTNWILVPSGSSTWISHARLQFSADGRWLVFTTAAPVAATDTNGLPDIYLYDFQAQTTNLISQAVGGLAAADGLSDSPTISADGRFIAWRSTAGNLVAGDTNGVADIFLHDRQSATTSLLTAGSSGSAAANERSSAPIFSADGRTLFFQSWATDLIANDYNQQGDLFALRILAADPVPVFSAQIAYAPSGGQPPRLTWPAILGRTYRVLFKDDLREASWSELDCSISIAGENATTTDQTPRQGQRFYRVVVF